jgi:Concanavalin A-like lectin/glucanases superfamily/PQQ-like domain/Domain of unknown function (DUF2341)
MKFGRSSVRGRNSAFPVSIGAPCIIALALCAPSVAEDWPTRLHDVHRSGVTQEQVGMPLSPAWTYTTSRAPAPAWTESPAVHDYLHNWYDLKPRQNFDRCYDVAVAGGLVYFGSSASGAITCLDASKGGAEVWTFFTGGPVRFAPHVANGKVYAGSDDGFVYCLDGRDGSVIWSERAGPTDEMVWGNEHMISVWPVRTSVMVDGGDVFWTAGIFPEEGMFVCKRSASAGSGGWTAKAVSPPQGYLLALPDRIIVPTGKTFPRMYSRDGGKHAGDLKANSRDGGSWVLVAPDAREVWFGPTVTNEAQRIDTASSARIASVRGANYVVVDGESAYSSTDAAISKMDRTTQKTVWTRDFAYPCALIKAGELLFAGGAGEVAAINADGQRVWTAPVDGNAYGLAVANGCLYVSTDTGSIHCFKATIPSIKNDDTAIRVTPRSAGVSGVLTSAGGAACTAAVFWGPKDGGTDAKGWANREDLGSADAGPLTASLKGLSADGTYFYRFRASNAYGEGWAPSSAGFTTGTVSVRAMDDTASEQGEDTGIFTISRPLRVAGHPLAVRYDVTGTATPGTDYAALSGAVTIPAWESDTTITVQPLEDLPIGERREKVTLALAPGPYVVGSQDSATVTITDETDLDQWRYRMKIVLAGYDRDEELRDFPVLVSFDADLDGFDYDQFSSSDGGDLRFTDGKETTFLNYEIDEWHGGGTSLVWVQVPSLTGKDTYIWALWGNPNAIAQTHGGTGAWSGGYRGVWHLGEATGPHADSAASANGATPRGGVLQGVPGVIGGADQFDGDDDCLALASVLDFGTTGNAFSAWVRVPKPGTEGLENGERAGIVLGNFPAGSTANWELDAAGKMRAYWNGGKIDERGTTDLRDGAWHHLAWVRDTAANATRMYVDGRLEKERPNAGSDITFTSLHIIGGDNRDAGAPNFHGLIDEARVAGVPRSAAWIWASWESQRPGGGLVTYGPVTE